MGNKKKLFLSIFIAVIIILVYAVFVNVCIAPLIKSKPGFLTAGIIQAVARLVLSVILWISINSLFSIKIKIKKAFKELAYLKLLSKPPRTTKTGKHHSNQLVVG